MLSNIISFSFVALFATTRAQLTGSVGPLNTLASKLNICNVLDYGGSIGSSDIGPAIQSAFNNCVTKTAGSTLYVPAGDYNMQTWVTLAGGTNWAFRLDGFITRTATTRGHMIIILNANDFEFYSANSKGGIQGNGYQCRNAGPRLVRIVTSTNWSLHDLIMVDSPEFHLIVYGGSNGEVYNVVIRGANLGGSDGIDVSGNNHWVHDVEVSNRDECVTVKSPASNFLIERIWCNRSGGSAIGSLGIGTAISNIEYKSKVLILTVPEDIYTNGGNQAMMIKGRGGDGYVKDVLFQNFISRGTQYGLATDQYVCPHDMDEPYAYVCLFIHTDLMESACFRHWSKLKRLPGNGVALSNINFTNWDGNVVNGVRRPPISLICDDRTPCTNITLTNVSMWSHTNHAVYRCASAYGSGVDCIKSGTGGHYAVVTVTPTKPAGYTTPTTMPGDLASGFHPASTIPVPASIPTSFYPGLLATSKLMSDQIASESQGTTSATTETTAATMTPA